jgi:hypothetical protein
MLYFQTLQIYVHLSEKETTVHTYCLHIVNITVDKADGKTIFELKTHSKKPILLLISHEPLDLRVFPNVYRERFWNFLKLLMT